MDLFDSCLNDLVLQKVTIVIAYCDKNIANTSGIFRI